MQTVEAQPVRAPRTGLALLIAAPTIDDPALRWIDGFRWQPELASGASAVGIECGGGTADRAGDEPAQLGTEEFDPFLVWAAERCSTKGRAGRDWLGRARRSLEAQQSYLAAAELWDGTVGEASGNANLASSDATTLSVSAVPVTVGLTWLDGALSRALRNRPGMVHVRPEVVPMLVNESLVRWDNGGWYTPMGHTVVADAGYSGDGPRSEPGGARADADGASQWMYATDLVSVRLGPVETMPASTSDGALAQAVERTTNDLTVWAQRPVGFQWDRHAHFAVEVAQGALA